MRKLRALGLAAAYVTCFGHPLQGREAQGSTIRTSTSNLRGVNKAHDDQGSEGIARSGSNVVRMSLNFNKPAQANLELVRSATRGMVPIPAHWGATCKTDFMSLNGVVDAWIAQAPIWTKLHGIINIANEWGPGYPEKSWKDYLPWSAKPRHLWRDSYTYQIKRMRKAGYKGTIMIDAGACGQDWRTIAFDGAAVVAADPLHNVVFGWHIYGMSDTDAKLDEAFAALKASRLQVFIGEFGPGNMIGPSPTPISPDNIIRRAEAAKFGWAAWAWDDNNLGGCKADESSFSMAKFCSHYTGKPEELTSYGRKIVKILHYLNKR